MKHISYSNYSACVVLLGLLVALFATHDMALALSAPTASTPTFGVVYSFGSQTGDADGQYSAAALVQDSSGNFYGTTTSGGLHGDGTVFKISSSGTSVWDYSFSGKSDGIAPSAALIRGNDGNYYGTTYAGGASNGGTVYKITPAGVLSTVYAFGSKATDGTQSEAGLVQDSAGNFYGTTTGGVTNIYGTVYKMSSSGTMIWTYPFTGGADGAVPSAGLIKGLDGNYYGTTSAGGKNGDGTVFKITPLGALTMVYAFSGKADGGSSYAGLVQGSDGDLYGTNYSGGANGDGNVFKITPSGTLVWSYSFDPANGTDGSLPWAGLVQGLNGNFFGTTWHGGNFGAGTVYEITPSGNLTTLYSFTNASDGGFPEAPVIIGSDGSFYGTTWSGGAKGDGAVFKLTTATPAAGSTYVLWNHSGQGSLWKVPISGSTATASFGPYSGWSPVAVASDTSGNAYLLWTYTNGQASIWKVSPSLVVQATQTMGPYSGWLAKSIAAQPDGNVHVLWNHTSDNEASIFTMALGSSITSQAYGPYTGWQAQQIAVDSSNNTRVLWGDPSTGAASLWNLTSAGALTSQSFGPYSGWQAQYLALAFDNQARIVWVNASTKQASVFTVASNGSFTSQSFGPYSGWSVSGLAVNIDGDSDLMWTNTSNQLSIFDVPSTGAFTSTGYGPYSGWKAIGVAAGP